MLVAAIRRFAVVLALAAGATAVISLALGALVGASPGRSVSLGFYCIGSFLLVSGFFVGNRGPVRLKGHGAAPPILGARLVRWATPSEREETLNLSALLVTVGFVLIVVGLALDPRYSLF